MLEPTEKEKYHCKKVRYDFENCFPPAYFGAPYNEARHEKWVEFIEDSTELTDREKELCIQEFLTGKSR